MENLCAIILTIILLLPIIVQLQLLIVNPKKLCNLFHYYACGYDESSTDTAPKLLQYYSTDPVAFDVRSDSKILLANLRTVSSSPELPGSSSITKTGKPIEAEIPETTYSSTFVKTDEVLPVVDITWNYNSYRYKAFEACLRNHYGNKYPPGEVVLNSMQLNLLDSSTSVRFSAGLFDFVKDSDLALNVSRKLEIDYLNPLDHFVTKRLARPSTTERFTETQTNEDSLASGHDANSSVDPIRGVITGQEKNASINRRSPRKMDLAGKCNLSSTRRVY